MALYGLTWRLKTSVEKYLSILQFQLLPSIRNPIHWVMHREIKQLRHLGTRLLSNSSEL